MEIMLKNKCCLYVIISIRFFSITIYNLLIEFPSYNSVQTFLSSSLLSKNINIKISRIMIMPVGLYGCGTCLPTLREERRLRVFENRVLRGPKGDKVTGEWIELHNEELNDL